MAAMTVVTVATMTAVVTAVTVLLEKKIYLNLKYIQKYMNFNYLSHCEFLYQSVK